MYFKNHMTFLLIILTSILIGCSKDNDDFETRKCNDWDTIRFEEYYLNNNVWNKGTATDYTQCLFLNKKDGLYESGWNWRWPRRLASGKPYAYPEVAYGWGWGYYAPTTTKLPRQINNLGNIQVSFDITTSASGMYNLAFDIWLTSRYTLNERQYITREIMIWLDSSTRPEGSGAPFIKQVTIDGEVYDLQVSYDWMEWTYIAFIKKTPKYHGNIQLHNFLNLLKNEGYISANEYLVTIEIGNEVWEGTGETRIQNYAISVN